MLATSCYKEQGRQHCQSPDFEQNPGRLLRGYGAVSAARFGTGLQHSPRVPGSPATGEGGVLWGLFCVPGTDAMAPGLDRLNQRVRVARDPLGADYQHGYADIAGHRDGPGIGFRAHHDARNLQFSALWQCRLYRLGQGRESAAKHKQALKYGKSV